MIKSLKDLLDKFSRFTNSLVYDGGICKRLSNIKLNFGRHVVTSFLSSTNIDKKYVDSFLNHFKMGTEDQGIYSNFNNQDYINTIMAKIDEIETNYMPSYIKVGDYDY